MFYLNGADLANFRNKFSDTIQLHNFVKFSFTFHCVISYQQSRTLVQYELTRSEPPLIGTSLTATTKSHQTIQIHVHYIESKKCQYRVSNCILY